MNRESNRDDMSLAHSMQRAKNPNTYSRVNTTPRNASDYQHTFGNQVDASSERFLHVGTSVQMGKTQLMNARKTMQSLMGGSA